MTRMRHAGRQRATCAVFRRLAGASTAVVLALGGVAVTEAGTAEAADEPTATQTIWSLDFEGEDIFGDSGWSQFGAPSGLGVTADPTAVGNNVLEISGSRNWDGIQSPVGSLTAGTSYNLSMRVRLVDPENIGARFVTVEKAADGSDDHNWIDSNTNLSNTTWTTISGVWKPSQADNRVYIGIGNGNDNTPDAFTVLVDDIVVTERGEPRLTVADDELTFVAGGTVTISGLDFPAGEGAITFEQDGRTIEHLDQSFTTDGLGRFDAVAVRLPVNVDPALPLDLVASTGGATMAIRTLTLATPSLTAPLTVARGGTVELTGSGFAAGMFVVITADLASTVQTPASDDGTFTVDWIAPTLPTDSLTITATSAGYDAISASRTISVTTTTEPGATPVPEIAVVDDGDLVPGDVFTLVGFDFPANQSGSISVSANGWFDPVSFTTDSKGQFRAEGLTIQNYWSGQITIHAALDRTDGRAAQTVMLGTPHIQASNAVAGGTVTIQGSGFIANESLDYFTTIDDAQTRQWGIKSDAEGRFTATAPVPYGAHQVTVTASQWGRPAAPFTIDVVESTEPALIPAFWDVYREGSVEVTGKNFPADVVVNVSAPKGVVAQATPSESDSFTVTVWIPKGARLGETEITATTTSGTKVTAKAIVNVIAQKPADRASITADQTTVPTGEAFGVTGTTFTPNSTVTLQYFRGPFAKAADVDGTAIGGATFKTNTIGGFDGTIAIPHGVSGDVTILASQGTEHSAVVTVTVTQATGVNPTITINPRDVETFRPGDAVPVTWTDLVPGQLLYTMTAGETTISDGAIVVPSDEDSGNLTIGVDTLIGKVLHTVTVTARQGSTSATSEIHVQNDFTGYDAALAAAEELIARRDKGEFAGVDAPWGALSSLIASNEFITAGRETGATQGAADRAEARLVATLQNVAEAALGSTIGVAADALAAYDAATATNPALAEALAGSARALVDQLAATSTESLVPTVTTGEPIKREVADYTFDGIDTDDHPGIPTGVWSQFNIVSGGTNRGDVLKIERVNDWEGLDFSGSQFLPGETCTFMGDVGLPDDALVVQGERQSPIVHFQARLNEPNENNDWYEWIGYAQPNKGEWTFFQESGTPGVTWTIPAAGVDHIRLVVTHDGVRNHEGSEPPSDDSKFIFYADNVHISCTSTPQTETRTEPATLVNLQVELDLAIKRLTQALALFEAGQVLWAPAPGNEPGWVEGNGLYTDDSLARWIGGNLYIRGNSSELEGRTFVANDLSLDKEAAYGWKGFNFGTVSIGSQIALSGDHPALIVCDDMGVYSGSSANINGGVLGVRNKHDGPIYGTWIDNAHEYCVDSNLQDMAATITSLSESLAGAAGADCSVCSDGSSPAAPPAISTATVKGNTLVLTAGTATANGLYVFNVKESDLAATTSIVIEKLQVGQSSKETGGRIDSMKPAVINVIKDSPESTWEPLDWTVDSVYLRDADGYDHMYVGDKFWHPDLGKVAGALMWNFPDAVDDRASEGVTRWEGGLLISPDGPTNNPAVTIRTAGLGVNFLGSILIPRGSLTSVNVSLNGRLYVGGDYLMDDKYEKGREGDPLYGGGYHPNGSADLLGHAEGHNYPWWFDPFTAAPSSKMTVKKRLATDVKNQLVGVTNGQDLFAKGRLRCMHVEDAAERQLTPQSDAWWHSDLAQDPYLLTVDVSWWLNVDGEDPGISISDLPQGTLCGIAEDLGLFTATDETKASGMSGREPRSSTDTGCECDDSEPTTPKFAPVSVPKDMAWALPDIEFDGAENAITVTSEGPTASLLLTTETKTASATITNSLIRLGQATIAKTTTFAEVGDNGELNPVTPPEDAAPVFEFAWSSALDGYVYFPGNDKDSRVAHLVPGARTGTLNVTAGAHAVTPEYCPTEGTTPEWWPQGETCLDLWFPEGAKLTWSETMAQHKIADVWYDVHQVDYQGGQTVTIPDGDGVATTAVTNTLVKAPLRFAVTKVLAGNGQNLVPAETEFTVRYEAKDKNGQLLNECPGDQATCADNTLTVRADGQLAFSATYEHGTVITLAELTPPDVTDVTWGDPVLSTTTFTLVETSETPVITVTNTAYGPASFTLAKALPAENVGTAWKINFDLVYTVYPSGDRTKGESVKKTHTLANGVDLNTATVTGVGDRKLQIGDIVAISEPADGFDTGFNWDKNGYRVQITGLDDKGNRVDLTSCEARGLENGCSPREFRITADNVNSLVVTVVNRLVGPPEMPMTGGAIGTWLALVAGLGLGGYLSFRRASSLRAPASRGGAMR